MVKMTLFLTRRSDLTYEQFSEYWEKTHWPIVFGVPEVKKQTRHYVQQHNIGHSPPGVTPAPFDGIAEAWFDSVDAALGVVGTENWAAIVAKDDLNFLDVTKTLFMFSEEKVDYKP